MWGPILLCRKSYVDAAIGSGGRAQVRLGLIRVSGHADGPSPQGIQQGHVAWRLVRSALERCVVGPADRDEHGSDGLVSEVQL